MGKNQVLLMQFAGWKGDGMSGRLTPNDAVQTMAKAAIG